MATRTPRKGRRALALALVALATMSGMAAAQQATTVERLATALERMLPLGEIFEHVAADAPGWPLQANPDAVTPGQLACVRGELSVAGYRRSRLEEARQYAQANPSRVEDDVRLLEAGAADLLGALVKAGADAGASGTEASPDAIMKSATSAQMLSMVTFVSDPSYAPLRKLSGYGETFDITGSAGENEKAGKQLGASLAAQLMLKAMATCSVPPSAYL